MQTRILIAEDTIRRVLFRVIVFTYTGKFYNLQNTLSHTKKFYGIGFWIEEGSRACHVGKFKLRSWTDLSSR